MTTSGVTYDFATRAPNNSAIRKTPRLSVKVLPLVPLRIDGLLRGAPQVCDSPPNHQEELIGDYEQTVPKEAGNLDRPSRFLDPGAH